MKNGNGKKLEEFFTNTPRLLEAAGKAVRDTLLRHKLLGQPIVAWKDGKVIWIPPEEIKVPELPEQKHGNDLGN